MKDLRWRHCPGVSEVNFRVLITGRKRAGVGGTVMIAAGVRGTRWLGRTSSKVISKSWKRKGNGFSPKGAGESMGPADTLKRNPFQTLDLQDSTVVGLNLNLLSLC